MQLAYRWDRFCRKDRRGPKGEKVSTTARQQQQTHQEAEGSISLGNARRDRTERQRTEQWWMSNRNWCNTDGETEGMNARRCAPSSVRVLWAPLVDQQRSRVGTTPSSSRKAVTSNVSELSQDPSCQDSNYSAQALRALH